MVIVVTLRTGNGRPEVFTDVTEIREVETPVVGLYSGKKMLDMFTTHAYHFQILPNPITKDV